MTHTNADSVLKKKNTHTGASVSVTRTNSTETSTGLASYASPTVTNTEARAATVGTNERRYQQHTLDRVSGTEAGRRDGKIPSRLESASR